MYMFIADFLADFRMQKFIGGSRVLQAEPFIVVICCGESMSIKDVIHAKHFIDPSVLGKASLWNHYP